jgi:hypothetical protein
MCGGAHSNRRQPIAAMTAFYHYDSRGSTIALTDGNGNITDQIEYSPYGTTTYRAGTNDTPFLYNGQNRWQPIAGFGPTFLMIVPNIASWSSRPCNNGRCAFTYIHPNASTQGPPTSSAVQVNQGQSGADHRRFPANRVRGAPTSGSGNILRDCNDRRK